MKKKLILSVLILLTFNVNSQDKSSAKEDKFLISLHYTGNIRNNNIVSDNYNGLVGLNAHYKLYQNESISILGGIGLDYFQARLSNSQIDFKNRLMLNPNFGLEVNASKSFKPFLNLGYSFFSSKYSIKTSNPTLFDPMDPAFQSGTFTKTDSYNSFSINPGCRLMFSEEFYFQADYKLLPIETNTTAHLIALGIGLNF
ncbi:outer membrane beta-barrel protein [Flavobacterium sp.]|uniref:outer membrane beta-barrel protein n=1 Tax=Flavobacterium sp. TaxID=239 RepID=UPI002639AB51|nr:outer membrane beta-barrel protein [Flavobacterium sp.]